MLERRYEYRRRVVPEEPITLENFMVRHRSTRILANDQSGKAEFRAIDRPQEVISTHLKWQIFEKPIQNLISFLQIRNVSTPSDNLIDRLIVVNNHDYTVLSLVGRSEPALGSLGARLPKRLCVVSPDAIAHKARDQKVTFEDLLCLVGTHEIVHTLTYQESWVQIMNTPNGRFLVDEEKIFRRDGIYTSKPPIFTPLGSKPQLETPREAMALSGMAEGIVQYITEAAISTLKNESLREINPYYEITSSIKAMMTQIGEEPFIQATFTREGFRHLHKAIETRYGKGGLKTLLQILGNKSTQPLSEQLRNNGFIP